MRGAAAYRRGKHAILAGAVLAAVLATGAYAIEQRHEGRRPDSAPGVIAPLSSIEESPATAPPPGIAEQARGMADRNGGDSDAAIRSLRLVRTQLGARGAALYMFELGNGTPCFILARSRSPDRGGSGACQVDETPTPGVAWIVSGTPTESDDEAFAITVVGLAADNVAKVEIAESDKTVGVPIVRNSFFYEIDHPAGKTWQTELRLTYVDGARKVSRVPGLPG